MACNPKPFRRDLKADMAWLRHMQKDGKVQNRYSPSRRQRRARGGRPAPLRVEAYLTDWCASNNLPPKQGGIND